MTGQRTGIASTSRAPSGFLAAAGLLGALASLSCCVLPLALFALGIGGAWIGNLTALTPYQPYFMAATAVCLAAGFWLVYGRRESRTCDADGVCRRAGAGLGIRSALWVATVACGGAFAFPYLAPRLLGL